MWWVPLIQAGIGAAQAIYSGVKAGNARDEAEQLAAKERVDNENWFNKEYYTNYTQRADSQNLLKNLREYNQERNRIAEGTAAITGATPESVQAQKNANNKVVTDTYSNIAAQGAQYKDNVMQQYLNRKYGLGNLQYNSIMGSAKSHETGMYNGIAQIGSGIAGAYGAYGNQVNNGTVSAPIPTAGEPLEYEPPATTPDILSPNYGNYIA